MSSGGGADYLRRLKENGLKVKTTLNLVGADFNKLERWAREGITIKVNFEGIDKGIQRIVGAGKDFRVAGVGGASRQDPLSPQEARRLLGQFNRQPSAQAKLLADAINSREAQLQQQRIASNTQKDNAAIAINNLKYRKTLEKLNEQELKAKEKAAKEEAIYNYEVKQRRDKQAIQEAQQARKNQVLSQAGAAAVNKFTYEDPAVQARKSQLSRQTLQRLNEQAALKEERQIKADLAATQRLINQSRKSVQFAQELPNKEFRRNYRQEEARRFVELSPAFSNKQSAIEEAAFKFNVDPRTLTNARRRVIDPRRLSQPGALDELGLTFLAGGPFEALGGLAGGLLRGREGVTPGAAVASAAVQSLESLAEVLKDVAESGFEFERSILGIASIFQSTSRTVDASGNNLPLQDQLAFQQGRARDIQQKSRQKLLPLGISGNREAVLVQGIIAGAAQRGINFDADQVATIASRFGSAILAQRPDLFQNESRLRLEVEDFFTAPGRRTSLTPLLRGFAPGTTTAGNADEYLRATVGLEKFTEALRGTSNVIVSLEKFNGAIDKLKTTVGSAFVDALTPAFESLAEIFNDESFANNVAEGAKSLGEILSKVAEYGKNRFEESKGPNGDGVLPDSPLANAMKAAKERNTAYANIGPDGKPVGLTGVNESLAKFRKENPAFDFETLNNPKSENRFEVAVKRFLSDFGEESIGDFAKFDIKNSGIAKLLTTPAIERLLPKREKEISADFTDFVKEQKAKIGTEVDGKVFTQAEADKAISERASEDARLSRESALGFAAFRSSGLEDFRLDQVRKINTSTIGGQGIEAEFNKSIFGKQIEAQKEIVGLRQKEVDVLKDQAAQGEDVIQQLVSAMAALNEEQIKLVEVQKKLFDVTSQRLAVEENLSNALQGTVDQETIAGQRASLGIRSTSLRRQRELIYSSLSDPNLSPEERLQRQIELGQNNVQSAQNARAIQFKPLQEAGDRLGISESIKNFSDAQQEAAEQTRSLNRALKRNEMALSRNENAIKESDQAIKLYANATRARALGREGQLLAAREAIVAIEGPDSGYGTALTRGSASFDEEARRAFDSNLARENFSNLEEQLNFEAINEPNKLKDLRNQKTELGLAREDLREEPAKNSRQKERVTRSLNSQKFELFQKLAKAASENGDDATAQQYINAAIKLAPSVGLSKEQISKLNPGGPLISPAGSFSSTSDKGFTNFDNLQLPLDNIDTMVQEIRDLLQGVDDKAKTESAKSDTEMEEKRRKLYEETFGESPIGFPENPGETASFNPPKGIKKMQETYQKAIKGDAQAQKDYLSMYTEFYAGTNETTLDYSRDLGIPLKLQKGEMDNTKFISPGMLINGGTLHSDIDEFMVTEEEKRALEAAGIYDINTATGRSQQLKGIQSDSIDPVTGKPINYKYKHSDKLITEISGKEAAYDRISTSPGELPLFGNDVFEKEMGKSNPKRFVKSSYFPPMLGEKARQGPNDAWREASSFASDYLGLPKTNSRNPNGGAMAEAVLGGFLGSEPKGLGSPIVARPLDAPKKTNLEEETLNKLAEKIGDKFLNALNIHMGMQ